MATGFSQIETPKPVASDSLVYTTGYGLRLGADISKPINHLFNKEYNGFEIVADYRITKKWYLATEIGVEESTVSEDFFNFSAKGSYLRVGANLNAYDNWLDMNNEIVIAMRYGYSNFTHTLHQYTPHTTDNYFPVAPIDVNIETTGLQAHWLELGVGMKVETFTNVFLGVTGSYKILVHTEHPANFATLYIPGFNHLFQSNSGFGFQYTVSYLIPFTRK